VSQPGDFAPVRGKRFMHTEADCAGTGDRAGGFAKRWYADRLTPCETAIARWGEVSNADATSRAHAGQQDGFRPRPAPAHSHAGHDVRRESEFDATYRASTPTVPVWPAPPAFYMPLWLDLACWPLSWENACMEDVEAGDYPVLVFLREQLQRARAENELLQQALHEAKAQLGPLRSALDTAEAELTRTRTDRTNEEGYLAEVLAQSERNLTHERHQVELTEANLASAQAEIHRLQRDIDDLRQVNTQVETAIENERRRTAETEAQLNAARLLEVELREALSGLQEAYDVERQRVQDIGAELTAVRQELAGSEEERLLQTRSVTSLQARVERMSADLTTTRRELANLKGERSRVRAALELERRARAESTSPVGE
jgi:hypothetical protein